MNHTFELVKTREGNSYVFPVARKSPEKGKEETRLRQGKKVKSII